MLWRVVIQNRIGVCRCLTTARGDGSEWKAGSRSTEARLDRVICIYLCVNASISIIECLGIVPGIRFDVSQRTLVENRIYTLCPLIVEVETFVRTDVNTVRPLPPTTRVHRAREVSCLPTDSFSDVVSVVGNLHHLHMLRHSELPDTPISVHVASIPVFKRAFLGIVRRSGVRICGFLGSRTY